MIEYAANINIDIKGKMFALILRSVLPVPDLVLFNVQFQIKNFVKEIVQMTS